MSSQRARIYTQDERGHAIARALEVGNTQASEELKIPKGTLSCWVFKARHGRPGYPYPAHLTPPPQAQEAQQTTQNSPLTEEVSEGRVKNSSVSTQLQGEPEAPSPDQTPPTVDTKAMSAAGAQDTVPCASVKKRVARIYTPSERERALALVDKVGFTQASRQLGISRFSLYQWHRRRKMAAEGKAEDPTAGPSQADQVAQRDREILDMWHTHPGLGPSQIRNQLRVKVSVNTVRRVMEADGYRPPKVKRHEHTRRYEAVRPNHLWHLDFVHRYINRAPTFTLIVLDDRSRFVVGHGVDEAEHCGPGAADLRGGGDAVRPAGAGDARQGLGVLVVERDLSVHGPAQTRAGD